MVYDPVEELVHILNDTAAAVYRMCDGKHNVEDMEASLRSTFHVSDMQDLRRDIQETLQLLREKNLLL